jgi:hypothetical protein
MKAQPRANLSPRPALHWFVWLAVALLSPVAVYAQDAGTITGQILAENGKAMADIRVSLSASSGDRMRSIYRTATTDENGRFQFRNLPNRGYSVIASGQKGYVPKPRTTEQPAPARYYPGDSVTITMMRGGIITGRVTSAGGDPLINIPVAAIRIRDHEGNKLAGIGGGLPITTDDRGRYRVYGLLPGTYIVAANNTTYFTGAPSPYYGEAPTYHPSSTRDTAAEVKVTSGDEASGIDIRYRGEMGYAISGKLLGTELPAGEYGASATLRNVATGANVGYSFIQQGQGESGFAIYGVTDGEYELTASRSNFEADDFYYSEPRRITVKGADVTGINLRLTAAAMVTGRLTIEKSPSVCDARLKTSIEDLSVAVRRDESGETNSTAARLNFSRGGPPDQKGDFKIAGIIQGRYRLLANLPNETWFIKSITGPAQGRLTSSRPAFTIDLTRASLPLKPGEKYSGATITVTDGGATLRGKVVPADEGAKLPRRLQVHMVPAELTAINDSLRFIERIADRNGAFTFANVTPGKYWLLVRALPDDEVANQPPQLAAWPAAWDAAGRAKLRKDAEAAKNEIELKTCQRVKDHVLRF